MYLILNLKSWKDWHKWSATSTNMTRQVMLTFWSRKASSYASIKSNVLRVSLGVIGTSSFTSSTQLKSCLTIGPRSGQTHLSRWWPRTKLWCGAVSPESTGMSQLTASISLNQASSKQLKVCWRRLYLRLTLWKCLLICQSHLKVVLHRMLGSINNGWKPSLLRIEPMYWCKTSRERTMMISIWTSLMMNLITLIGMNRNLSWSSRKNLSIRGSEMHLITTQMRTKFRD